MSVTEWTQTPRLRWGHLLVCPLGKLCCCRWKLPTAHICSILIMPAMGTRTLSFYHINTYKYLKDRCHEDAARLFLVVPSGRMRTNGHTLKCKIFYLNLRKNLFSETGCPGKLGSLPSWRERGTHLDTFLCHGLSTDPALAGGMDCMIPRDPLCHSASSVRALERKCAGCCFLVRHQGWDKERAGIFYAPGTESSIWLYHLGNLRKQRGCFRWCSHCQP